MARAAPLPRTFWVLWTGTLLNRAGTFVEPFLILYLTTRRGLEPAEAGTVLVAYGAGAFVSQLVGGGLADHLGRRFTLLTGMLSSAAALLALGAARTTLQLLVAAAVVGVVGDLHRPAVSAMVSDVVDPADRPRAFGLIFWAVNLGWTLASVTAGFLAEVSYTLIFLLDAATCGLYALVVLVGIRRDPPRRSFAGGPETEGNAGFGTALRDPVFMTLCAMTVLSATVYMQVTVTLPLSMVDHGLSPHDFGVVVALNGLLIVLLQPWVSARNGRFDRMRFVALSQCVLAVGSGLTAFARTVPTYSAAVVVWTLGEIMMAGLLVASVADLAPTEARGRYQGVFGTSFGLATLLAPLFGTRVYQHVGNSGLWLSCLGLGLLSALGYLSLGPALRRRTGALVSEDAVPG